MIMAESTTTTASSDGRLVTVADLRYEFDRERRMEHVGQHRAEARLVRLYFAGQAHAGEGASVEGTTEGDHRRALGVMARDLHRVFDRFGAGRQEYRFLWSGPRDDFVEALGKRDVVFVRRDLKAGMGKFGELRGYRGLYPRVQVSGVEHGDTACEVDVATTFDIPDLRVARMLGIDLQQVADTARDRRHATSRQIGIGRHGQLLSPASSAAR